MSDQGGAPDSGTRRSAWWDDPLTDEAEGRLGRAAFAEHAAHLISANHSPATSVVYGLEGPWGSGKSTVINFIKNRLERTQNGLSWKVVRFTPWATSGPDALFSEFFNVLVQVAPDAQSSQELRAKVGKYALIARPLLAAIPVLGSGAADAFLHRAVGVQEVEHLRARRSTFHTITASNCSAEASSALHPVRSSGRCLVADTPSSKASATTRQPESRRTSGLHRADARSRRSLPW